MTEKQIFKVLLEKDAGSEATAIYIPFDMEEVFGAKRVPVKAFVKGVLHRTTVTRMGGRYIMVVPKRFREAAGITAGDLIEVTLQRDTDPRTVEIPKDLAQALKKAGLQKAFSKMSYTHQKEYVNAINEAKKPETRVRRIRKAVGQTGRQGDKEKGRKGELITN